MGTLFAFGGETHPQPLPPKGGEWNAKAGDKQGVQGRALSLGDCMLPTTVGSSFASGSGGRFSCPIAGSVLSAAPKVMFDRFPMLCMLGERKLFIMYYTLKRKDIVRPLFK